MRRILLIQVLLAVLLVVGCAESNDPETPGEAVQAIVSLYEQEDFDTLIRSRYAEIWKAEDEQQIEALVDRFKRRYADETKRKQAIDIYRAITSRSPEMSEDGSVAIYRLEDGFIQLSRMPKGKWGFTM